MLRIAICDDEQKERQAVTSAAETFFQTRGWPFEIRSFPSASIMLKGAETYDLYFLDVLMPGTDGIRAAEIIKAAHPKAVIVFITSMIDSAVDSYRVEAAGFLLKPVNSSDFNETMERLVRRGLIGPDAVLEITYNHMPMAIPVRRIVALESDLHRVYIRLDGDTYTVSQRLRDMEELVNDHQEFVRCHQSFIVNLNYVSQIEGNSFILNPDANAGITTVPISRVYLKACKKAFYDYRLKS